MELTLEGLPTELIDHILRYLPISNLLAFASTSRSNYNVATKFLTSLDLAIFPRRIHSLLAFFDACDNEDDYDGDNQEEPPTSTYWRQPCASEKSLYQIGLTTPNRSRSSALRCNTLSAPPTIFGKQPKSFPRGPHLLPALNESTPLSLRTAEIYNQNNLATTILSTPSLYNLRSLTLRLYDFSSAELAYTIATKFPYLTALNLEFSHPYIHDTTLPSKYWKETVSTGSPIWNTLAGVGESNQASLCLRSLKSLSIVRSGITSFQLRHWIKANPELRKLRLSLCRGVDLEFVTWLAEYVASGQSRLKAIRLVDCGFLELKNKTDFEFIDILASSGQIRELSLQGCKHVSEAIYLQHATGTNKASFGDEELASQSYWSAMISKLVSPKGVVIKQSHNNGHGSSIQTKYLRGVSPAVTVSDAMMGTPSSSTNFDGGYFGKTIEVDPAMAF